MNREFFARLRTMAREKAEAVLAKIGSVFRRLARPDHAGAIAPLIAASEGNVLNTGKRYRKTSGHAPLFSLFTYFANR